MSRSTSKELADMARDELTLHGTRYIAQRFGLLAIFAALLFGAAGSWSWLRGWAYLFASGVVEAVTLVILVRRSPEMVNQRGTDHAGVKTFDKAFAGSWLLLALGTAVVAGLDAVRFGWSELPWSMFGIGLALLLAATAFGTWAMLVNEHFEQFVRIQDERGHRVVSTGPYRMVRHPGYLAAALGGFSAPLMLGSVWTFVPAGLLALLFVVRTSLEDRTLLSELDGYSEYAEKTRSRLVPFVW